MTPELAQHVLNFLARVDMKGQEAPLFMACIEAVRACAADGQAEAPPSAPQNA